MHVKRILKAVVLLSAVTGVVFSASAQSHPAKTPKEERRHERKAQLQAPSERGSHQQRELDRQLSKLENKSGAASKSAHSPKRQQKVALENSDRREKNPPINFHSQGTKGAGGHGQTGSKKRSQASMLRRHGRR
jgi:TolA-binding protein